MAELERGNEKVGPERFHQVQQIEWNPAKINCISKVSIGDSARGTVPGGLKANRAHDYFPSDISECRVSYSNTTRSNLQPLTESGSWLGSQIENYVGWMEADR